MFYFTSQLIKNSLLLLDCAVEILNCMLVLGVMLNYAGDADNRAAASTRVHDSRAQDYNRGFGIIRHNGLQTIRPRVYPPRVDPPHVRPKRGRSAPNSGTIRRKFWVVPPRSNCTKPELK